MGFSEIIARIAASEPVGQQELLPYLCLERRDAKGWANKCLAEAYFKAGRPQDIKLAKMFVERAFELSGHSADLLPLYIAINMETNDIAAIKAAYKRLTIAAAAAGNIPLTAEYF